MNPYETQPEKAFWRKAVGTRNALAITDLWQPRFGEFRKQDKVVTAGSCFAQHIGRALAKNGFAWFDAEPAPPGMSAEDAAALNYGVFSFRTGNIYTTSLLLQWLEWAFEKKPLPEEVWETDGRFFDPFRPVVEPGGFSSAEEVRVSRAATARAVRRAVEEADFFVFTLGLTECWHDAETGLQYPMCPGTAAGEFDPDRHQFKNLTFEETRAGLDASIELMRERNPRLRILLTVSPVPLTATATDNHVLLATTYSKSLLRTVASSLVDSLAFVDYFPSYEIITAPAFRGMFFEPNMRSVAAEGVAFVMQEFFRSIGADFGAAQERPATPTGSAGEKAREKWIGEADDIDTKCEEALLEAFGDDQP